MIPCRSRNDVLLAKVTNETGNTLDKQAAEEIIKGMIQNCYVIRIMRASRLKI